MLDFYLLITHCVVPCAYDAGAKGPYLNFYIAILL
jgi:hypothetical protein